MPEKGELLWARRHNHMLRAERGAELCFGCGGHLAPGAYECATCGPIYFGKRPSYVGRVLCKLGGMTILALIVLGALQLYALLTGK